MKDLAGQLIQFATYQNGTWYNSGLDYYSQGKGPSLKSGGSYQVEMVSSISSAQEMNRITFTVTQSFPPMFLDDLGQIVNGQLTQEVFDSETGQN